MPKSAWRDFDCSVVNERVRIRLKREGWLQSHHFVLCNQAECQYVEKNELPCPLHLGMFADAIREIEARRREAAAARLSQ